MATAMAIAKGIELTLIKYHIIFTQLVLHHVADMDLCT
jgi:hypothetical protein